jgi:NADH-quinone oxidoreductase subunit M
MSYLLSLAVFLPMAGSVVSYLVGRADKRAGSYSALAFSVLVLAVSLFVFWSVYSDVPPAGQYSLMESHPWIALQGFRLDFLLGVDGLSSPLILLTSILGVLAVFGARSLIDKAEPAFYALLLFAEGTMIGAFASLDLILFYLFWELTLVPVFFLIGVWGGERRKYAALKFIIFTFGGSAIMLLGFLSLYFGVSPQSFNIPDLAGRVPAGLQYLPLLAIAIGFAVELPAFPFHSWQPDAYEQAPAPVNVLLAGVLPKFAGYGVIRIAIGLFPQASQEYAWAFMLLGAGSMFYGAIVALLASDLKRMFAYTSISHMGFVVLGAFATVASGNPLGLQGAILQMFAHGLAIGALFMLSGPIEKGYGTREIPLLGGLRQRMPLAAVLLAFSSCAAMALPPFANFLAELMVISGGVSAYPALGVTVLVPVITGAYLLWMLKRTVLTGSDSAVSPKDISAGDGVALALYLVPLVILLVFSSLILSPAAPIAAQAAHIGASP